MQWGGDFYNGLLIHSPQPPAHTKEEKFSVNKIKKRGRINNKEERENQ
jgi:hypothetical protein